MNFDTLKIPFNNFDSWSSKKKLTPNDFAHIFAYIASLKLFKYRDNGKIDSASYIRDNFKPDPWHIGLYNFLMTEHRGDIIYGTQYSSEYRSYSALVPLVLAAHKQLNDIPYSSWSIEGLDIVVNKTLYEAMTTEEFIDYTREELIAIRDEGLVIKSGAKAGQLRSPVSTATLVKVESAPQWARLPKLAKTMLTQTWLAHPQNRTDLMVLHPRDWDLMPEPLDSSDIFVEEIVETTSSKLPWDI